MDAVPSSSSRSAHHKSSIHPPGNIDTVGIHRDLSGYYRAFGLMDTSTADGLFGKVVWPHLVVRTTTNQRPSSQNQHQHHHHHLDAVGEPSDNM